MRREPISSNETRARGFPLTAADREARAAGRDGREPDGRDLMAARNHVTGEIQLAVELERSRVDRQCAGGRAGLCGLVDDAWLRAELGQPQRKHQTSGPGADDQHVRASHIFLHRTLCAENRIMRRPKSTAQKDGRPCHPLTFPKAAPPHLARQGLVAPALFPERDYCRRGSAGGTLVGYIQGKVL